jgi:hypothetical protein
VKVARPFRESVEVAAGPAGEGDMSKKNAMWKTNRERGLYVQRSGGCQWLPEEWWLTTTADRHSKYKSYIALGTVFRAIVIHVKRTDAYSTIVINTGYGIQTNRRADKLKENGWSTRHKRSREKNKIPSDKNFIVYHI